MEWFIAIVVGLLVGWAGYALFKRDREDALLSHLVAGLLGGLAGKWLLASAWVVGNYVIGTNFNLYSVLWAAVGSIVFVGIWRAVLAVEAPEAGQVMRQ